MDELTDDLDQDVEEPAETPGPTAEQLTPDYWQRKAEKAGREAQQLRTRLRRTEMTAKHGADIVELIPETLPLKEQESLADKLAERLRVAPSETVEVTEEAAPVEPTPQEQRLATVNSSSPSSSPAVARISAREWMDIRQKNPAEANKLLLSGGVELAEEAHPRTSLT